MKMDELIRAVADVYKNPEEGDADKNGNTRLAVLQKRFHLSALKVQKILVTAGVYEPVKAGTSFDEITWMRKQGKSVEEIVEATGYSNATVSACFPYTRSVYNADQSGADISSDAKRKRKQRNKKEGKQMKMIDILQDHLTDASFWKAIQEHGGETFVSAEGKKYLVYVTYTAAGHIRSAGQSMQEQGGQQKNRKKMSMQLSQQQDRQEMCVHMENGGVRSFSKKDVLDVLHNALELKADGIKTDMSFFEQTSALPYVYPLLVFFGVLSGDRTAVTTRRSLSEGAVCSCCGRRAEYRVGCFADLIRIAADIEEKERSRWEPEEREKTERMEASFGRVSWEERAKKDGAAIRAFNKEGERWFCTLCAQTIRMALEDGELPHSDSRVNLNDLTLEAAEAGFDKYLEEIPKGIWYEDWYGRKYSSDVNDDAFDDEASEYYFYTEKDKEGIGHSFVCYKLEISGYRSFEAIEVHRLTKAGKFARDYTGTDYEFRIGQWAIDADDESRFGQRTMDADDGFRTGQPVMEESEYDYTRDADRVYDKEHALDADYAFDAENMRKEYICFLELVNKIKDALLSPSLEWHEEERCLSNAVTIGRRQCTLQSAGQMQVVYVNEPSVQGRDWHGGEYGYMIDGIVFTGEEVALMSSAHEGWNLQYRFADPSDQMLRAGEYLMPVRLGDKELVTEVSELLNLFTADGRFISEHDRENFGILFERDVLKKIRLYYESNPLGYGKLAAMQVVRRLQWVEGTERQMELVRETVRM